MRGRRRLEYCRHLQRRQRSLSIPALLRPRLCMSLCEGQGVRGRGTEQVGVPLRASTPTPHPTGPEQDSPVTSLPGRRSPIALTCEVISVSLYTPLPLWTMPHHAWQSVWMGSIGLSLILCLLTSQFTSLHCLFKSATHCGRFYTPLPNHTTSALAPPSRRSSACQ